MMFIETKKKKKFQFWMVNKLTINNFKKIIKS